MRYRSTLAALLVCLLGNLGQGCGGFCTGEEKASICFSFLDAQKQELSASEVKVFATIDGGPETAFLLQGKSLCIFVTPYPKKAQTLAVRALANGKEGKRTVKVGFDGCHPITQKIAIAIK